MVTWRFWGMALLTSIIAAGAIGIPTVLIPNSFFIRMTPSSALDYGIWLIAAMLLGLLAAFLLVMPLPQRPNEGTILIVSGVLALFAVGCPICNKLIVAFLGTQGAMTVFNPLRPFLGIAALALLGTALFLRLQLMRPQRTPLVAG